jgi:hypothetical protein
MGSNALQLHTQAQRSLTSSFDASIGGLTQNGDIADE